MVFRKQSGNFWLAVYADNLTEYENKSFLTGKSSLVFDCPLESAHPIKLIIHIYYKISKSIS